MARDTFTAIDLAIGKPQWSQMLQGTNISVLALASHTTSGTIVLNTTATSRLVALDEQSGATLWTLPTPARADTRHSWQVDADRTTLYFADSSQVRAMDLATGTLRWQIAEVAGVPTSVVIQGQTLYETDGTHLVARDAQTGQMRWHQSVSPHTQVCAMCMQP
jgi:outer membrane protein assembly factor BamB